jgi:hypothetical protein
VDLCSSREADGEGQLSANNENEMRPVLFQMKNSDHDGLFVTVDICQIPLYCLLDTGSTMSVLHSNIFKKLPQKMQTRLKTSNQKLRMA